MTNRASAELAGTIATMLFALAIPCAVITLLGLALACIALSPCMFVVRAAYEARVKADIMWNNRAMEIE
jgi:hypothetical protein